MKNKLRELYYNTIAPVLLCCLEMIIDVLYGIWAVILVILEILVVSAIMMAAVLFLLVILMGFMK